MQTHYIPFSIHPFFICTLTRHNKVRNDENARRGTDGQYAVQMSVNGNMSESGMLTWYTGIMKVGR
jgi:hypothetical protein